MRLPKLLAVAAAAAFAAGCPALGSAQISIQIGQPPACPYGYYGYAPYRCAPYGYYGPQWFNGGVFIGAGRWFHGPRGFHGDVNDHYDPRYGYHGAYPHRGEHWQNHDFHDFHGSGQRDFHGHQYQDHGHGHDNGHDRGH
jgi:hypothetical protein